MQFLLIILIISFILYLFVLHVLTKEDLIFVRKNITLESLFNLSFLAAGVGLLFSRIVFIIHNPSMDYLNPLVFFLFPYFPGLSLPGGLLGGIVFLLLYSKRKKVPLGRIFDFFLLSFLASLPLGLAGSQLLVGMRNLFVGLFLPVIFLMTVLFSIKILLPLNMRGEFKDGSLGFLIMILFSITLFSANMVQSNYALASLLQVDNILLTIYFLASVILLVKNEKKRPAARRVL